MKKLILSTLMVAITAAPSTWAKPNSREAARWATVTDVQPITQMVRQGIPQKECWDEPVRYQPRRHDRYDRNSANAGAIIGTIIGGAIGNNVSNHRRSGTVIGAVIGASVGHNIASNNSSHRRSEHQYVSQRRCQTTHNVSYQKTVIGYDVWYRYQGNEYKTQMDHHPGNKIRVRFSVEPY